MQETSRNSLSSRVGRSVIVLCCLCVSAGATASQDEVRAPEKASTTITRPDRITLQPVTESMLVQAPSSNGSDPKTAGPAQASIDKPDAGTITLQIATDAAAEAQTPSTGSEPPTGNNGPARADTRKVRPGAKRKLAEPTPSLAATDRP